MVRKNKKDQHAQIKDVIHELTRQNDRLAIINQIAQSINVEMSYGEIIEQVAAPLRTVVPYDLLSFCLMENNKLIIKSAIPKEQTILGEGWILDSCNSAPWKAIRDKRCFLRQDIRHDSHKYQEDDGLLSIGIHSAIMAPLLVKNEVIGTLNLGSHETAAYSEQDFVFVQQLADQLAVGINNARLFSQVSKIKAEWEQTFQAVPDKLFLIDNDYAVLRHNQQLPPVKEDEPLKCYELFSCCDGQLHLCPTIDAYLKGKPTAQEVIRTGQRGISNVAAFPVWNDNNQICNMVIYVQDITAKKKMENQLFESAKLAAVGEMAAGVAHELNSPLTAIIGNSDLLLRRQLSEEKSVKLLEDIKSCGQRSKRIIQNLLTFSQQDSYLLEPVFINDVVKSSLSLISYQIEKNNIKIFQHLASNIPPLMGNKLQLEQVMINFLLNARDALDGVMQAAITISTGLHYDPESGSAQVRITVEDNGQGIPEDAINQIFNPFFTLKGKNGGTGLGLSLSLGIAQTHGGKIDVWSEVGSGSIFTLILPL